MLCHASARVGEVTSEIDATFSFGSLRAPARRVSVGQDCLWCAKGGKRGKDGAEEGLVKENQRLLLKACLQQRIAALIGTCSLLLAVTTYTEVFSI